MPCPTDETMAAYVDHRLSHDARRAVEAHLARCDACLEHVVLLQQAAGDLEALEKTPVPEAVSARARALLADRLRRPAPFLDLVVRAAGNVLEILRTTGESLAPELSPVPVRGPAGKTSRVLARSRAGDLEIIVELESRGTAPTLRVLLSDSNTGERPDGLRIDLDGPEGRETRYVEQGLAEFDRRPAGVHLLHIEETGDVRVELTA